jgi:cytochrome c oxidase subunit 2
MSGAWLNRLLPAPASSHAAEFDRVLSAVHLEGVLVFLGWLAVFAYILVRFRARPGVAPGPTAGSRWPLAVVAVVVIGEVWLLAGSALPAWVRRATPAPAGAVEVRVVGEQFAWNFHYPGLDGRFGRTDRALITAADPIGIDRTDQAAKDDFVLIGVFVVPVNRPVVVHLSSKDVIHSFTLATMRVKQDITPGLPVTTWFTPIATGTWEVGCSQLCGLGHYRMRALFEVRSDEAWRAFLQDEVSRVVENP